jgi:hypothetical protein
MTGPWRVGRVDLSQIAERRYPHGRKNTQRGGGGGLARSEGIDVDCSLHQIDSGRTRKVGPVSLTISSLCCLVQPLSQFAVCSRNKGADNRGFLSLWVRRMRRWVGSQEANRVICCVTGMSLVPPPRVLKGSSILS